MAFIPKKRKAANAKVDANKAYSLKDASSLVKEVNTTKFDASVDLHIRLGVDPKKADQAIRGTVTLPHGTGKTKKYWCFAAPTRKLLQKAPVLIMLVLMNLYKRLKVAGQM
jgi:large subunit ribosomal protein L1